MKVILNENIENLGRVGDEIDVKPGYARNYLLPRKLAVPPTKHNIEIMKYKRVKAQKQFELEKLSAVEQKQKLEEMTLTITKKAGESETLFGSVTPTEIQGLLEEMGLTLDKKKFHLDEPIKKLGLHVCKIKLMEEVEAELKINVLREGGDDESETQPEPEKEVEPEAEVAAPQPEDVTPEPEIEPETETETETEAETETEPEQEAEEEPETEKTEG